MATKHPLDSTEPSSNAGGRPPALKLERIAILHGIVMQRAQRSLREIADELHRRGAKRYGYTAGAPTRGHFAVQHQLDGRRVGAGR